MIYLGELEFHSADLKNCDFLGFGGVKFPDVLKDIPEVPRRHGITSQKTCLQQHRCENRKFAVVLT